MSLRDQPSSERAFATFVILALAALLASGLAFALRQERARAAATPPAAKSRLVAVLEGVMAPNVSPAETETFRIWVQGGATREGFAPVEAIVANKCSACHSPGAQFPPITGYEDLRPLAMETVSSGIFALIGARTLHLIVFPLLFLVAAFGYLRQTAWRGRRLLMSFCAAAVAFDATQWWLRQGHPGAPWASGMTLPWLALALLGLAFLALAAVVLKELWLEPRSY